jgi:hypothetical protein
VPFSIARGAYRATGVRGAMCATFPNMQQLYRHTHEDEGTDGTVLWSYVPFELLDIGEAIHDILAYDPETQFVVAPKVILSSLQRSYTDVSTRLMRIDKSLCGVDEIVWRTGKAAIAASTSSSLGVLDVAKQRN